MKSERLKMKNEKWLTQWFCVALIFFFLFSFFTSCSRDNLCDTPFGMGASIDIYQPDFAALLTVGGTVTINRGYKGIFIRRTSYSNFVAFECACPHCHETRLIPHPDWNGAVLQCPDCHSMFETEYGNPLDGSATGCMLYEYRTIFDGYTLEIY
jgi:hypothetical protein